MKKKNKYFYEMKGTYLNIFSIIIFIVMLLFTLLLGRLFGVNYYITTEIEFIIVWLLYIPYIIFHEILHSIGYVANGADFKRITYGVHLEKGVLCCSCKQVINRKNILWSLIYPLLFIGIITYVISAIFNLKILMLLSIFNISGCAGDIIMFFAFLKIKNFKFFEYDNPMAFGVVTNENLENKKFIGLKRIEESNFKQTIDKKISISKTSIIFFAIYIVIMLSGLIFALMVE